MEDDGLLSKFPPNRALSNVHLIHNVSYMLDNKNLWKRVAFILQLA